MKWLERWKLCYIGIYFAPLNWRLVLDSRQIAIGPIWLDWSPPLKNFKRPS